MVSPAVSKTLRWMAGIEEPEEQAAPQPTYTAPFQDEPPAPHSTRYAPSGQAPPPARDDYRLPEPTTAPALPPEPASAPEQPASSDQSWIGRAIQGLPTLSDIGSGIGSAAHRSAAGLSAAPTSVQDAYAVPADQRPPQYSGPSYAQPRLPEGQRPYVAPTETESAAVSTGFQHAAAAEPVERVPIPFTGASLPIPAPLQSPAGAVAGGLEALGAADQAVRARIDPRVWGFAKDGIRRELFTPEELAREAQLRGAMDPETGARYTALTPAEQDELAAMDQAVEQRYQQIKDDPDALTRYANASPAYGPTSAITDIALTPALGAAAGGAATRGAQAAGASARTARGIGYAADIAAQTVVDPTTPLTQGPVDAALAGLRTATRAARVGADRFGSVFGEGRATAARLNAEPTGTITPGVFGISGIEPNRAEVQGMRPRIIPEDVADQLDFPIRPPTDPAVIRAIEAAGGTVDERGTTLNVIRHQDPEAAGGAATRSSVFYTAGPPGAPSEYARTGTVGPQGVGGQQRIEGRTRFRNPLFISDAPGEARGFDDAMRQFREGDGRIAQAEQAWNTAEAEYRALQARFDTMDIEVLRTRRDALAGAPTFEVYDRAGNVIHTAGSHDEAVAWAKANGTPTLDIARGFPSHTPEWRQADAALQNVLRNRQDLSDARKAVREAQTPVTAAEVEDGIRAAKRSGPAGSPERAAALKDLVTRYGGDPDVIDDLIELRGAEMGESVYAVKENIVAGNARRAGHDGVITMKRREAPYEEVATHPPVKAAFDARETAIDAAAAAERAHQMSPTPENWRAYQRAEAEVDRAVEAYQDALNDAQEALRGGTITELADPRELRNPTPGAPSTRHQAALDRVAEAEAHFRDVSTVPYPRTVPEREALHAAETEAWAAVQQAKAAAAAVGTESSPPGYTLRPDIPARAGTPEAARRAAEAAEEAAHQARLDAAFNAPDVQAAGQRVHAAEEAYQAAKARWQAGDMADRSELDAAFDARGQAIAEHARLQREAFQAGGGTANVSAGALPAERIGADRFGAVNRVLGQGVMSGVTGGVGAQVNQELNPDDPYAGIKGFAAGALVPPLAQRGARALARAAGAAPSPGGGALATAGGLPEPHYRPELSQEPVLPGLEPPRRVPGDAGPSISEAPNLPGNRLGNVPPSQVREPVLPGFKEAVPGAVPEDLVPSGATVAHGPSGVAPSGQQPIGEALPEIIRQLNAPPPRPAVEGASLPLTAEQSGIVPRLRAAIDSLAELASSGLNKVQVARVAGMVSDTAGQIANIASGPGLQAVDIATGPIAAALDVGRVAGMKAVGKDASRQVFFAETGQRLRGMRAGAGIGLERAWDVLKGGADASEAAKLEQRSGFGTNIPGIAPKGSAVAGGVDFAVEAPLRALGAADAVFKTSAQGGHLMAEAYAAARQANGGTVPTPEMIREAAKRPEVLERVQYLSSRSVLQEDRMLTNWYKRAMNYRSDDPVEQAAADLIKAGVAVEIPFVRTPYNVVAQGMGMTPAGLLGVVQDVKQGKAAREVEQRLARVMLGTAVMAPVAAGLADGRFTGPYPETEKERSLLPPGWRPWSIKAEAPNGETYYLPISYAQTLALPIVMALLSREAYKKDGWSISAAGKVAAGVGEYATQETFLGGFNELFKLMDSKTSPATMQRHVEQLAASYVPHIIGGGALGREIQRVMGMPARDPEGPLQAMQATLPYLAGGVEPRQDVLGREASLGLGGPAGAVVRAGEENDAAVLRAFRRGREGLPMSAPDSLPDPDTGRARALTERQQHRWRRVFGRELRAGWSDAGQPADPEELRAIEAEARTAANETVLGQR